MRYDQIDSKLFIKNRKSFTAGMKPNSLAVFNANDIYPIGADSTMPFEQHRDTLSKGAASSAMLRPLATTALGKRAPSKCIDKPF